jgi:CIC family chloride channel protein
MLGALTGSAFGAVAIDTVPHMAGSLGLYALAGMGAVSGAVLGAPISTTLIVFELTGDWQAGIAVMVAVALASVIADRMVARSFFLTQLARKGLNVAVGPQGYLRRTLRVGDLMRPRGSDGGAPDGACWELHRQGASLDRADTLARALPMFERLKGPFLPVMAWPPPGQKGEPEIVGALFHADALRAYARALEDELREEHS